MTFIGYKMTHDTGFAPNPYFGELTLATCKPVIRRTKRPGDWVAGFASTGLVNSCKREGVTIPYGGLIYLMKIREVITLDAYFNDPRFRKKRPVKNHRNSAQRSGDNIYYCTNGRWRQLPNNSHDGDKSTMNHDVGGLNVLIADMNASYYFGANCPFPGHGWEEIGVRLSKGRNFIFTDGDLANICAFLNRAGFVPGINGEPCLSIEQEDTPAHGCCRT